MLPPAAPFLSRKRNGKKSAHKGWPPLCIPLLRQQNPTKPSGAQNHVTPYSPSGLRPRLYSFCISSPNWSAWVGPGTSPCHRRAAAGGRRTAHRHPRVHLWLAEYRTPTAPNRGGTQGISPVRFFGNFLIVQKVTPAERPEKTPTNADAPHALRRFFIPLRKRIAFYPAKAYNIDCITILRRTPS